MGSGDCDIGIVGLGVMGRNLLLNIAEHGFCASGYDVDGSKVDALKLEPGGLDVQGCHTLKELTVSLKSPGLALLLVPASVVDSAIEDLAPLLEEGDIIVDGGNSYFRDTERRADSLAQRGIQFIGMGVSGGEAGARHGPSLMPGGPRKAYEHVRAIVEAIAARADGEACVTYIGPRGSGHYVKMIHNGIEYGLMELIAECYDLMHRGLGLGDEELAETFAQWNEQTPSFLLEITSEIFRHKDELTGMTLVDVISDAAQEKGTGTWTAETALEVKTPSPNIDVGVTMRDLSMLLDQRRVIAKNLSSTVKRPPMSKAQFVSRLANSLSAGMLLTYAQGMNLLQAGSHHYGYEVQMDEVAKIWRGGCIIRSAFLDDIRKAYRHNPEQDNLLEDSDFAQLVSGRVDDLRATAAAAIEMGVPAMGLGVAASYYDAMRSQRLPMNLIQAQRDFFGSHTYQRVDRKGTFHTDWAAQHVK